MNIHSRMGIRTWTNATSRPLTFPSYQTGMGSLDFIWPWNRARDTLFHKMTVPLFTTSFWRLSVGHSLALVIHNSQMHQEKMKTKATKIIKIWTRDQQFTCQMSCLILGYEFLFKQVNQVIWFIQLHYKRLAGRNVPHTLTTMKFGQLCCSVQKEISWFQAENVFLNFVSKTQRKK